MDHDALDALDRDGFVVVPGVLSAREVALTGPAGTASVFSSHLLHRGSRNRSPAPRPSVQAIWRRPGAEPPR